MWNMYPQVPSQNTLSASLKKPRNAENYGQAPVSYVVIIILTNNQIHLNSTTENENFVFFKKKIYLELKTVLSILKKYFDRSNFS